MPALRHLLPGAALLVATPLHAHDLGGAVTDQPPGWTWDPSITLPLALTALAFAIGWARLDRRSSSGASLLRRRAWLFAGGMVALAGALVSPLHQAGERSFAAHMVEHELLMLVAAPLLVASGPLPIMLWAFPAAPRRALGLVAASQPVRRPYHWLSAPVTATILQASALWLWHAPSLFDRALASNGWHIAQHASFLVTALLFWTAMLGRQGAGSRSPARYAIAAVCLFITAAVTGGLGALMAVSESPWYAGYQRMGMAPFGLTPTQDQQIAGLIMWVPGGLVHAAAALVLLRRLLLAPPTRRAGVHAA